jgi:hypothetical protein
MVVSIGVRQIPQFRRAPADITWLPFFVLALTFVIVPIRIAAFASMFHQGWASRPGASRSGFAVARTWMPALVPRLGALFLLTAVAASGALLVSAARTLGSTPATQAPAIAGEEVILEAPSAQSPDR